jgi:hypothetical protein
VESKNQKIVQVPTDIGTMTPEERRKVAEQLWETLSSQILESHKRNPQMVALDELLDDKTSKG